jgi:V/A-type H+-transporting ATPase subunit A
MNSSKTSPEATLPVARVVGVKESLITIDATQIGLKKNEVGYIRVGDERLKSEVLRIQGGVADMQVFEDTKGVKVGDEVEMTGSMLSVTLGPGLLGQVFDGLQNPLQSLADKYGFFLPRGVDISALDVERKWAFEATAKAGQKVFAGDVLGTVEEGILEHKIMVPFDEKGELELKTIESGSFTIEEPIAKIKRSDGREREVLLSQPWPVRKPVPQGMIKSRRVERLYPSEPLTTGQRIIDAFFPVARGGTGCIPGPFGAGKTVLQSAIAKYATVDIVIIIACGERAGEVVETILEYPATKDPRTGGSLMDRTIIICNTSSMPVAAREASIYTGITLGEYYRQMGLDVLCIADSTSRWAQALRETSGRMEEIPGEEAFPAYLDSAIKNLYERAGVLKMADDSTGSLTLLGTVSPAGGNFEEPVTQATLGTVKTFLGLSAERAYKRFYPAIDPLISWSRYLDQLSGWFTENLGEDWVTSVKEMMDLLDRGDSIYQMMQVTGEEGITLEDFVEWQKATLLDMVYLQQDAFDPVDAAVSRERQLESFRMVQKLINADYDFKNKDEVRDYFTRVTGQYKNWNYSEAGSPDAQRFLGEIETLASGQGADLKS